MWIKLICPYFLCLICFLFVTFEPRLPQGTIFRQWLVHTNRYIDEHTQRPFLFPLQIMYILKHRPRPRSKLDESRNSTR